MGETSNVLQIFFHSELWNKDENTAIIYTDNETQKLLTLFSIIISIVSRNYLRMLLI